MSNILELAKKNYQEKLNQDMRTIEVPEWGNSDGPLMIYIRPANLTVFNKIAKLAVEGGIEALVEAIILRSKDENGVPLFAAKDKKIFMYELEPSDVVKVGNLIIEDMDLDGDTYEDAVKN